MRANQVKTIPHLSQLKRIHIVGVCGTLMGAFASFLKRSGIEVTGSDGAVYPPMSDVLRSAGITLYPGYRAENIDAAGRPDLVVIGNVIRSDNPEAQAALSGGFPTVSLPEAMEALYLGPTQNLVVAGTHGKTTTSSLLAHILSQAGCRPSYFIGGVTHDLPHSFHVEDGSKYFVLEGDEYDTAFWDKVPKFNHYLPNEVILTSIEYDHADIYPDLAAVEKAFEGLVTRIRKSGSLIACLHEGSEKDESVKKILNRIKDLNPGLDLLTYGTEREGKARFFSSGIRQEGDWTCFEVIERFPNQEPVKKATLRLQIPGVHNVLNATAVWILCDRLGLEAGKILRGMETFRGVKRRQEVRGEFRGVLVIDDFAHHPTAVRETLRALKLKYPKRRLVTVFEPRSATSRRKVFQSQYAEAFQEADQIYLSQPYDQTRISKDDQFSSEMLVQDLVAFGKRAELMPSVAEGIAVVAKNARSGDLIAVLSNGGFEGFVTKLTEALGR